MVKISNQHQLRFDPSPRFYVYGLVDPINKLPFYIGKGSGQRAYDHLKFNNKQNTRKLQKIKELRDIGVEPLVHILQDKLDEFTALKIEDFIIREGRKRHGWDLTNEIITDPTKASGSLAKKKTRRPYTPERSLHLSKVTKGVPRPRKDLKFQISRENLEDLYTRQKFTQTRIAKLLGVSTALINRKCVEYDLRKLSQRRSKSENC